jgi:replicative superfamily II helicase
MNLIDGDKKIVRDLLSFEHRAIAEKLGFIPNKDKLITNRLLVDSIGLIDKLSRIDDQKAKKIVITLSAILWNYRRDEWDGLKEFLILVLSRAGFPPSSIMIDNDYDYSNKRFSSLNSLINEYSVTLHQLKHEIFVQDQIFLVTGFQKNVWDKMATFKLLGISAPTSAGKSYIILLKAIELILKKEGNIIYIVPTLSLVSQVSADFNYQLKAFGVSDYRISTTYNVQEADKNKIYVLTQEKAISAFSQNDRPFKNIRMLIVDEIQNIEKVANEDDQRAKTLYDTLIEFRYSSNPDLTVMSGPRVEGLKNIGVEIFNEQSASEEKTKDSPVASFTYAISKTGNSYFFNQYSDILDTPNKLPITDNTLIKGYGKSRYQDDYLVYLSNFIRNLGADSINIIFSPTTAQARKTAIKFSESKREDVIDDRIISLITYIEETVHNKYDLCFTIKKGIAYHHGKMPTHVRAVIERAIKDKLINNVVCTTTLMQGVNLPAQNVIIRNPDLAIQARNGIKPTLTNYEIANLRGRAGRLLKDLIGRTFVLEEAAFDKENDQTELFPEAEKELHSGYGEKYLKNKESIDECLISNTPPSEDTKEYSFLLTYIRQVILKHEVNSQKRLQSVGIELNEKLFNIVSSSMASLSVPVEICYKNRYWDPLDLNELYKERNEYKIPTAITEYQIEDLLTTVLIRMSKKYPLYFKRYFGSNRISDKNLNNFIKSACISTKEWIKETSLKDILNKPYFSTPEKIERRIDLIQNKISFGLPMLLKPLYDIQVPDSMFLTFIETGAYKPISRRMIELNIPRDTAIFLSQKYFNGVGQHEEDLEKVIITKLNEMSNEIDYWRRIQIEMLL